MVRTAALTALDEEIGADDVERVLLPDRRRRADLRRRCRSTCRCARRARRSSAPTSSTTSHARASISRLAEKSGLERTHLYRKLKQLGLGPTKKED